VAQAEARAPGAGCPRPGHHGAVDGVTGSCHQLTLPDGQSRCWSTAACSRARRPRPTGAGAGRLEINFPLDRVRALVVTHVHIDHVGRIPYLLAAGFKGPIVCSEASAQLLPLVIEDALKVGFTRDKALIGRVLAVLRKQIVALPYKHWHTLVDKGVPGLRVRLQPAGHILGSAYVELDAKLAGPGRQGQARNQRVVFSGDLGAPYTPLLPAPKSPYGADVVVHGSTYGDRTHEAGARAASACRRCASTPSATAARC
jgi:metallo-beta-lactamase family protein